jgi:hypothetical protein
MHVTESMCTQYSTVGDHVLQKINVSVIMSFRSKLPRCKQVLMIILSCTNVKEFKIFTVSTDRESTLSDMCTVQNNHKQLV